MIWLLPPPPPPIRKLDRRHPGRLRKREDGRVGVVGGGGAKSFDGEKILFSINHSILSGGIICSTCQLVPHHSLKSLSYWF
jgi:hypothetical protein